MMCLSQAVVCMEKVTVIQIIDALNGVEKFAITTIKRTPDTMISLKR